jgi:hypothetical protein
MKSHSVAEPIAIRRLHLADNPRAEILLVLGRPQSSTDFGATEYRCPFQTGGIGVAEVRHAAGVDEFQAIELAFRLIGAALSRLNRESNDRLRWKFDESGGLGFPQP